MNSFIKFLIEQKKLKLGEKVVITKSYPTQMYRGMTGVITKALPNGYVVKLDDLDETKTFMDSFVEKLEK